MLTRKEIFQKIKAHGLQEAVKERWHSDYTRVSSAKLMEIIVEHEKMLARYNKKPEAKINDIKPDKIGALGLKKAFVKLLTILQTSETLYPEEVEEILQEL
jgi:hypothetical protein